MFFDLVESTEIEDRYTCDYIYDISVDDEHVYRVVYLKNRLGNLLLRLVFSPTPEAQELANCVNILLYMGEDTKNFEYLSYSIDDPRDNTCHIPFEVLKALVYAPGKTMVNYRGRKYILLRSVTYEAE